MPQITSKTLLDDYKRVVEYVKTDEGITLLDEVNSFGFEEDLFNEVSQDDIIDNIRGVH